MFIINVLSLLLVFVMLVPVRLVSRLSEKLLENSRNGGWDSSYGDQMRLAFANGATLRQAKLYTAYPGTAFRVTQMLRLFGVR